MDISFQVQLRVEDFVPESQSTVKEYICSFCEGVLVEPVVDHCGHIFCRKCVLLYLKYYQTCPHSSEPINENEFNIMNFIEKILEKQTIYCKNKEKNCDWIGKYQFYDNHLKIECEKQNISCSNTGCSEIFMRGEKEIHLEKCEYRLVKCDFCSSSVAFILLIQHHDECTRYPVDCPLKCGLNVERQHIETHSKNECENAEINCLYKTYGCESLIIKKNMTEHIKSHFEYHNTLVLRFMADFHREHQERMNNLDKMYKEINERLSLIKSSGNEIDETILKNKRNRNELDAAPNEKEKIENTLKTVVKDSKIINTTYINRIVNGSKEQEVEKSEKAFEEISPVEDSNWTFNTIEISNGLAVEKNKVTSISSTKNIHLFAFMNAQLKPDSIYKWKVNIQKYSTWIAFGICDKAKVIKNHYIFTSPNQNFNSGCFLLSSNFYSWNCNNVNENNKSVNPNKKMNFKDSVLIEYNGKMNEIQFSNGTFSMKLTKVKSNGCLVPCIIFLSNGDEIIIDFLKKE